MIQPSKSDQLLVKVRDYVSKNRDKLVAELQEWVKEPSLAGNEAGIQNLIEGKLKSIGMDVVEKIYKRKNIIDDENFVTLLKHIYCFFFLVPFFFCVFLTDFSNSTTFI